MKFWCYFFTSGKHDFRYINRYYRCKWCGKRRCEMGRVGFKNRDKTAMLYGGKLFFNGKTPKRIEMMDVYFPNESYGVNTAEPLNKQGVNSGEPFKETE